MRKRKQHRSGLRAVREASRLSQQAFADAIGSTKAIIENVEMGRSPLTEQMVNSIVGLTGVDPASLGEAVPIDFNGAPYSFESWERWRMFTYSPKQAEELVGLAKIYLQVLLTAAHSTPQGKQTPHLFRTLLIEFNHWMFDRIKQHNLDWIIEHKVLASAQLTKREAGKTTVGILRSHHGDAPGWQANDDSAWQEDTEAEFSSVMFPLFEPFMMHGRIDGKPAFISGHRAFRRVTDITVADRSFQVIDDAGTFGISTGLNELAPREHSFRSMPPRAEASTPPSGQPSPTPPPAESPKKPKRRRA